MAQPEALTFPGVAANGRAVLTGSPESAIVYLVSPNEGFIMSTTTSATMGFFQPQSGPFSAGSINGNYFGGTVPPAVQSTLNYVQGGVPKSVGIPVVNDAELLSSGSGFRQRHARRQLQWRPGKLAASRLAKRVQYHR